MDLQHNDSQHRSLPAVLIALLVGSVAVLAGIIGPEGGSSRSRAEDVSPNVADKTNPAQAGSSVSEGRQV
ncbi:MAG: hypothetical protein N2C12_13000, partial [Planctomycetales bacterium]